MKNNIKRIAMAVLSLLLVFSQLPLAYASTAAMEGSEGSVYVANASGSEELQQEENESVSSAEKLPEGIVPGKVMVKYKSNISAEAKNSLKASVSAVGEKSVKKLGITELELSEGTDVQAVVEKLNADSNVEFAEPVYVRKLASAMPAPTVVESVYCQDEFYYKGWQWGLQTASMDELWGEVDEESQADIVIAVIDTGVDMDNPEFSGRLVDGYDFVNNDSNPDDDYGHGTHVAGIAAAANDGNGMGGVASGASIMPVKILDAYGYGDTVAEVNGIIYAVNNGADVINLSLGGYYSYGEELAIEYAIEHGVVVVAAAGNDSYSNSDYPACLDGVISVGAADWNGSEFVMADFSNYGSSIDMVAPGVDILSAIPEELDNLNSGVGDAEADGYALMSGTSMATPFVAGAAALLLAKGDGIDMDSKDSVCEQVLKLMQEDGVSFSYTDVYSHSYDYKLLNGNNGNYATPFLYKGLQLSAEETAEDNKVELYLTAGDYRNGSVNTLNGTYEIKRFPASRNEEGYYEIGDPQNAGTIELKDGEGTTTVEVDGDYDYIFVAEGDDAYMDSDSAVPQDNYNSFDTAKELQIGETEYGVLSIIGDEDYFTFTTPAGGAAKKYLIESLGNTDTEGYLYAADKSTELGYDDDYENRNFGILYELEPATTYYVKVIGYNGLRTGYYGIHVEEFTGEVEQEATITGTLSLPEGSNITGSLTGTIWLLEGEFSASEGYSYYNGNSADFTISNGETVNYSLQGEPGYDYVVAYMLSSGTDITDFVKAAYYTPTGMVAGIDSSWVLTESQTANMKLLPRTAAEPLDTAYDTIATAKELKVAENITALMDYPGDVDYYKISIKEADNYILKFLNSSTEISQADCKLGFYDAEGNKINFTSQDIMYENDENVAIAGGFYLEAGEYYLRIEADDDIEDYDDLGFEPLEMPMSINKGTEINCTVELPDGTTEYSGYFYLTDSLGMKHLTYKTLTPAENSICFRVPVNADGSYTLGYRRESSSQYDDMGYYCSNEGGITVADIKDATPILTTGNTTLSFKLTIMEDGANNSMESALVLPDSGIYTGTINNMLDEDYFILHAAADGTYVINYKAAKNNYMSVKAKAIALDNNIIAILRYEDSKWVEYAEGEEGSLAIELEPGDHYFKVIGNITDEYEDSWFIGTYQLGLQSVPVASNVKVSGTAKSGNTLTGSYNYTDAQGDAEAGSTYRWLRSAAADGIYAEISGATGKTYKLTSSDVGKYIKFEVTPASDTEPSTGAAVLSSAVGPIAQVDSTNNNNHHNGGSGSGSGSGTGTTTETTTNQQTPSGSAVITTGTNGSTSSVVQVDSSKLAAALNTPGTNPVTIDVRTATNTDNTEVLLPGGMLREAEKLQKPVIVQTNNASFEIQPGAINLGDTDQTLRLEVQELTLDAVPEAERNVAAADDVSMVFDFGMYLGSQRITDFNKPITITVKYDPSKVTDTSKLGVYYYNEKDGRWEYVGGKVNSDGTITFTVDHFSKYAVMEFKNSFEDIKTHWAKQSIELILARQITNGVDQKSFAPDRKISRAEFAVMLARALKLEKTSDKSFADVAGNAWYKDYLQKAYAAGIISGDSFAPGSPITREQMAEMLVRAYSYSSGTKLEDVRTTQQIRFKDESLALGTSRESIILADALGLMNGNPDGTFAPKGNATRAEAAVTIIRLLEKLGKL